MTSQQSSRTTDELRTQLERELESLAPSDRTLLEKFRFDREALLSLASDPDCLRKHDTSRASPPESGDIVDLPTPGSPEYDACFERGAEALRRGQCALVVLAGGMATRMGGVVKALVEATQGKTFLDLRLAEQQTLGKHYGVTPPLWLLTSHSTEGLIQGALRERLAPSAMENDQLATFQQRVSLRLTAERKLYRDEDGKVSFYAPGHGDFPEALRQSGLLERFIARGGKYVMMTNLDNLGGGLDPAIIGFHLGHSSPVTCEVVDKWEGDRGGIPLRVGSRRVILEEFLVPKSVDPDQVRVFNSNTLAFDAEALLTLSEELSYFPVHKETDGKKVLQFERMVHEVTFGADTTFLRVPRSGPRTRFLPVKNHADLAQNQDSLLALAKERGMLAPGQ